MQRSRCLPLFDAALLQFVRDGTTLSNPEEVGPAMFSGGGVENTPRGSIANNRYTA